MRLQEQMGPKLGSNPVPLEPFGHQVAGQASMLSVDPVTVCKPLIAREHHLYRTLPSQLIPFTPRFKGVLFVRLEEEEDGRINLLGYGCDNAPDNNDANNEDADIPAVRTDVGHGLPAPTPPPQYSDEEQAFDDRYLHPMQYDWSSGASTPLSSGSEIDLPSAVEAEQFGMKQSMSRPSSSGCIVRVKQDGEYEIQTAADDNRFLISADKESDKRKAVTTQPLNPWGYSLHTRLLDKMRKSSLSASGCPFLVLENVVAHFRRPCILDLKVGSRLHGDGASSKKIASQSHKCNITTSKTLGLRLCGMQVFQEATGAYKSLDKYFGRTLNDDTFYNVLHQFLHNGNQLRTDLLAPIIARLRSLHSCLEELDSFRFYASSLLIMYDGDRSLPDNQSVAEGLTMKDKSVEGNNMSVQGNNLSVQGNHVSVPTLSVDGKLSVPCFGGGPLRRSATTSSEETLFAVSPTSSIAKLPATSTSTLTDGSPDNGDYRSEFFSFGGSDGGGSKNGGGCEGGGSNGSGGCNCDGQNTSGGHDDGTTFSTTGRLGQDNNPGNSGHDTSSTGNCVCRDNRPGSMNGNTSNSALLVDVRMIDFAHTTHAGFHDDILHEGPDLDYMWGLGNLVSLFERLHSENC